MQFKWYCSKPINRKALQIHTTEGNLSFLGNDNWNYEHVDIKKGEHINVNFKAHQVVNRGDWIVYLNGNDVCHCTDQVFRERNIVPA